MKVFLPLILLLLSLGASSQAVQISGRFYYDDNGNHLFDGADVAMPYQRVYAIDSMNNLQSTNTDNAGNYSFAVNAGSYYIGRFDGIGYSDYIEIYNQHTDYFSSGSHIVDFAYQKKDSIVNIQAYISDNGTNTSIPAAGTSKQYSLHYSFDGSLPNIPVTVTLNFNPLIKLAGSSLTPSVISSGKLQWNFPALPHIGSGSPIILTFTFPAVGDTIGSFILSPKIIPGITLTSNYANYTYDFYQQIDFPASQPIGPTSGIKWLRPFQGKPNTYAEGTSIDTTQNGEGYFIAGYKSRIADSSGNYQSPPFIAKLNKDGLSIWEKYLDSMQGAKFFDNVSAIAHTGDGGCIVLGSSSTYDTIGTYSNKIIVSKFDTSGSFVWTKALSATKYGEAGQSILPLADGSILITGDTNSHDGDFLNNNADTVNSNLFVTKLSPTGSVIFTRVYGGSKDEYGYKIIPLQNNSFLVLAGTASNDGDVTGSHNTKDLYHEEAWVLNIDGNGNIIWNKCFGGSKDSYFTGAAENGGGIMLTGSTNSKDGDLPYYPEIGVSLWALQISTTGNIVWNKFYKLYKGYQDSNYLANNEILYDNSVYSGLHKTKDGNFVVGGSFIDKYGIIRSKHGSGDFVIIKLNTTGDIVWQKAMGGTRYDYINDIQVDKNDNILFVGSSGSGNDDLYQHGETYQELMVIGKVGITNIIKGRVFIDNNGNHIKDAGEQNYSEGRINSVKAADTIVSRVFDGGFFNNADTGNYVSVYKPANNYYTIFPASHTTSFNNFDLKDSFDFALSPKPAIKDLEVQLLPLSTPRPGFDVTYRIITKNVGTATINNAVIGFKKDSRQTYLDASRDYSGAQADSIWWGPFTLNAFDTDTLYAAFTLAAPPTLNNGDTLSISVTANPLAGDSSVANNVSRLKEIVRGSFDPNDKTEIHAGTLTTTQYANGESLQYLVRFQNTGTDTAFFITVKDTLQTKLDLSTLEIISASHPFSLRMNGNVATWDFKNIKLPDSTSDEAGSHGFILFKIKPATGLTVGDEFINKAAIYFDYNLPVITNEDKTVIGSKAGICPSGNASFIAGIAGSSYQWQVNTGTGFTNLTNAGFYSGVNSAVLVLTAPPSSLHGYRYRCLVNGNTYSPENILKFSVRWKGSAGSAWENADNWDCGVLPNAQTEVIIPAGVQYPLISSNASCYSLRLSPGSTVTVKSGFKLAITGKAN